MNEGIFREYDVRGIAETDLTDDVAFNLGRAYGTLMSERGHKTIIAGRDLRLSSPRLHKSFVDGALKTGLDVLDIGQVTTPIMYFSILHFRCDGGIMITGSHNPIRFNGFKMNEGMASVYGKDIQTLKKIILKNKFVNGRKGQTKNVSVANDYIDMLKGKFDFPKKLKIVVDAGNATAGPIAPELWESYGHEVLRLYCEPDGSFPNHMPDPSKPENLKDLIDRVLKEKADLGLAYDGDADRVGAVDETGRIIYADTMLAIFAKDVLRKKPGSRIIFDVKCSQALPDVIKENNGIPYMYKTGHSLIKAKMKELKSPFAGEMSGHMFFADDYYGFDDGIYASGRLAQIVSQSGKKLSAIVDEIPRFESTPEIRIECADEAKFNVVDELVQQFSKEYDTITIDGARVQMDGGWGLVRASNTEPTLVLRFEAKTRSRLREIMNTFKEKLSEFPDVKIEDHLFNIT